MIYLGVDIGGTGIKVGAVTATGEILCKESGPTQAAQGYEVLARDITDLINKLLDNNNISIDDVGGIGLGCPGSIDDKNGVVLYSNNINLKNAPLCDEVKKHIDKPVFIGNDANCAALGEYFALKDDSVENFVAITLGTGIGGGVIIDKKIYTGSNGIAGELGHTSLVMDGEQCSCGRQGCWEAYASITALNRDAQRAAEANPESLLAKEIAANGGKSTGKIVYDCADNGCPVAKQLTETYIKYVGEGITNLINIFQPSCVAIGGGVSAQGDKLLIPVKEYVNKRTYGNDTVDPIDIVIAKLGNDAGIVGAALLAL
ncbi:MAG: ROK family protein, partial [Clostridia bacterium]|nr:ROK family protein [Clostridia bacterium]